MLKNKYYKVVGLIIKNNYNICIFYFFGEQNIYKILKNLKTL